MNRALSRITLALTLGGSLIGALMSPALADGDPYYSNGINASGVRTPIPAPIPVPVEEAFWYLRADFAAGFGTSPSVAVLGTNYADLIAGAVRSDSFEPSFTGGVGIGYVWGPYFRTDITVDVHSLMNTELTGTVAAPFEASLVDKTKFMSTILLANAYYDIRTGTAWSPYLGLGVGFAVNQVTRNLYYSELRHRRLRLGRKQDDRRAVRRRGHGRRDVRYLYPLGPRRELPLSPYRRVRGQPEARRRVVGCHRRSQRTPDPRRPPVPRELGWRVVGSRRGGPMWPPHLFFQRPS